MTDKTTFDAVYENGVFRPLEPLPLVDGLRVGLTMGPPEGPLTPEQVEAEFRLLDKMNEGLTEEEIEEIHQLILGPQRLAACFEGLTEEEADGLEADILGPERMAARRQRDGK